MINEISNGVNTDNPALKELEDEFAKHVTSGSLNEFRPATHTALAFARFSRDLEMQREVGKLTDRETAWLGMADKLLEKISKFNREIQNQRPIMPEATPRPGEEDYYPPPIVPGISAEMADRIIADLNKQFEEKVLRNLDHPPSPEPPGSAATIPDFGHETGISGGRTLQDYFQAISPRQAAKPFLDEDSHTDLRKFVQKVG